MRGVACFVMAAALVWGEAAAKEKTSGGLHTREPHKLHRAAGNPYGGQMGNARGGPKDLDNTGAPGGLLAGGLGAQLGPLAGMFLQANQPGPNAAPTGDGAQLMNMLMQMNADQKASPPPMLAMMQLVSGTGNAKPLDLLVQLLEKHALKTIDKDELEQLKSTETTHVKEVVRVASDLTEQSLHFEEILAKDAQILSDELEKAAEELSTLSTEEALAVVAGTIEQLMANKEQPPPPQRNDKEGEMDTAVANTDDEAVGAPVVRPPTTATNEDAADEDAEFQAFQAAMNAEPPTATNEDAADEDAEFQAFLTAMNAGELGPSMFDDDVSMQLTEPPPPLPLITPPSPPIANEEDNN